MRSSTTIAALARPGPSSRASVDLRRGCRPRRRRGRQSSIVAVGEAQAATRPSARDLLRVASRAAPRRRAPSIAGASSAAARGVELALHQAVHEVHDGRLRSPAPASAVGGLEPEQAAADDGARGARSPRLAAIAAQSSGPRKTWTPSARARGSAARSASRAGAQHRVLEVQHRAVVERRALRSGSSAVTRVPSAQRRSRGPRTTRRGAAAARRPSRPASAAAPRRTRSYGRCGSPQTSVIGDVGVALADGFAHRLAGDAAADDEDLSGRVHAARDGWRRTRTTLDPLWGLALRPPVEVRRAVFARRSNPNRAVRERGGVRRAPTRSRGPGAGRRTT